LNHDEADSPQAAIPDGVFPLSAAQRGIWYAQQFTGDVPIVIAQYIELNGPIDVDLFAECVQIVGKETGSGLVRIVDIDGQPHQYVSDNVDDPVTVVDLRDREDPESAARRFMEDDYSAPIDLYGKRLTALFLLRLADERWFWYSRSHHVALDGFGAMLATQRVAAWYTARLEGGDPEPLAAADLPALYADDVAYRQSSRFEKDREFWLDKVRGLPDAPSLSEAAGPISSPALIVGGVVDEDLAAAVDDCASRVNSSAAPVIVAAFAAFVARMTRSVDTVLSVPLSARNTALLRRSGGMVSNIVPLRLQLPGNCGCVDAITQAQLELTGALRRQRYRHEDIRRELPDAANRLAQFGPSVNIMMFSESVRVGPIDGRFHVLSTGPVDDLAVNIYPGTGEGESLRIDFEANPTRYDLEVLRVHRDRFIHFLRQFVDAAETTTLAEIDLLGAEERQRLIPARAREVESAVLLRDLISDAVAANPDGFAVTTGSTSYTYRDFDQRTDRLARALRAAGAGPEGVVAVGLRRSANSVAAFWGITKSGAAFLPIDPAHPAQRVHDMIQDAGAALALTDRETVGELPESIDWMILEDLEAGSDDTAALDVSQSTGSLAYLIYTSGSSGRPKGVGVTHRGLANVIDTMRATHPIDDAAIVLGVASTSFDAAVYEMLLALAARGTLAVAPRDAFAGTELAEFIDRTAVTHMVITPTALSSLDPSVVPSVRWILSAGEALPAEVAARWAGSLDLVNAYGPTETTIIASLSDPIVPGQPITIGHLTTGMGALVLDDSLQPVPPGVVGELYLLGSSLARGYARRPGLTAARFVASPFTVAGENRMYRTGDLARWLPNGELHYMGRSDSQVKIRGLRVELGEIDNVLLDFPGVVGAVTVMAVHHETEDVAQEIAPGPYAEIARMARALDPTGGDQPVLIERRFLASYVAPRPDVTLDRRDVLQFAARRLPGHMVPSTLTVIDSLPMTVNGKIDRKALPEPVFETKAFRAPRTVVEQLVARVFGDLVGSDTVGLDDDFFAIGGNSLIATRAAARLGAELGGTVPVRLVFDSPTVEALAQRLTEVVGDSTLPPLRPMPRSGPAPLSLAQRRMWFLNRLDPGSPAYNVPLAVTMTGHLDTAALSAALLDVLERHETLRSRFPDTPDGPVQDVRPAQDVVGDLTPIDVDASSVEARVLAEASRGFDVTAAVPVRTALFRVAPDHHVAVLVTHHICADGASMAPLARDLMIAYASRRAGEAPSWTPLPVQYSDFALWQREALGSGDEPGSVIARQEDFWRRELDSVPEETTLMPDRPRPRTASYRGATVEVQVPTEVSRALSDLAHARHATLFMVVHAALAVTLARSSAAQDVVIGTPIAGRNHHGTDDIVGMFVNTLALRTAVRPDDTVATFLDAVRETDLAAFANADVPFERLVEILRPTRSQSRHPLFQVVLAFQNIEQPQVGLEGLTMAPLHLELEVAKFDLQVTVSENQGHDQHGLSMQFSYATDILTESTVEAFARRMVRVMQEMAAVGASGRGGRLADIDLVEATDLAIIEKARSRAVGRSVDDSIVARVLARADTHPDAPAVVAGETTLTYRELVDRSARIARRLRATAASRASTDTGYVAVAMSRSADLVVAMFAVMRAGYAYVPVDPEYPDDRIAYVLEDSGAGLMLADDTHRDRFSAFGIDVVTVDADADADVVLPRVRPMDLAYAIYTSGSTGRPKGVMVPHANVCALLSRTASLFEFGPDDVWTMFHSHAFDFSVWEIWGALSTGGSVVVVDHWTTRSPDDFLRLLVDRRVTVLNQTPSAFYQLSEADRRHDATRGHGGLVLRWIVFGGEALDLTRLRRWFERHGDTQPRLVNMYGITETTVHVTEQVLTASLAAGAVGSVIGGPIDGLGVAVLDAGLRPVPVGVPGELYVMGAQVARGYLDRPGLNAVRFVANPYTPGERMYRSGDLVRWRPDGQLEYIQRADQQVQLRGFRIELGEIETVLASAPGVADAAAAVRATESGETLVGFVVPRQGSDIDPAAVRAHAAASLPAHMVPSRLETLEALPLTVNGKLNRAALPETSAAVGTGRPVSGRAEEIVAEVFASLLGIDEIGADTDFFEAGGDSLVATQVAQRVGTALGTQVSVRQVFETPTVGGLAAAAMASTGSQGPDLVALSPRPVPVPLAPAQQRIWFSAMLDSGSSLYNLPLGLRLRGDLDVEALSSAVADVVARHEVLRTRYPEVDGSGVQEILDVDGSPLRVEPEPVAEEELLDRFLQLATEGFDLATEVPVRIVLLTVAPDDHVLVTVVHHIAADGFSRVPLTRDIGVAYSARQEGTEPAWTPLAVQFADYAVWQRSVLGSAEDPESTAARQLAHWRSRLAGLPAAIELPRDRERPATRSLVGSSVHRSMSLQATQQLSALAARVGATRFMVVHAALSVVLGRLSGRTDVPIGTPLAGRGKAVLDDLVGMFVNTVVLRTEIAEDVSFEDYLEGVRSTDLDAFDNADVPFESVVDAVLQRRDPATHPLFQTALSFRNIDPVSVELAGLQISELDTPFDPATFDLLFTVDDTHSGRPMGMMLTYATDMFDQGTAEQILEHLVVVLTAAVAAPTTTVAALPMAEVRVATRSDDPEPTAAPLPLVPSLLERVVDVDPTAPALVSDEHEWTYTDLDGRSNQVARVLLAHGVGPGSTVSAPTVAVDVVWGALKTGAAVAVTDDLTVADAVTVSAADGVSDVAVTGPEVDEQSRRPITYDERTRPIEPSDVAVTPVAEADGLTHRELAAVVDEMVRRLEVSETSRVLATASAAPVLRLVSLLVAGAAGAEVVLAPGSEDDEQLTAAEIVADEWVTHLFVGVAEIEELATVDDTGDLEIVAVDESERITAGVDAEMTREATFDVRAVSTRNLMVGS
jgi:amino acid adenylation domain-containing protein